jgi:hypothetical protein
MHSIAIIRDELQRNNKSTRRSFHPFNPCYSLLMTGLEVVAKEFFDAIAPFRRARIGTSRCEIEITPEPQDSRIDPSLASVDIGGSMAGVDVGGGDLARGFFSGGDGAHDVVEVASGGDADGGEEGRCQCEVHDRQMIMIDVLA